MHLDSPIPPRSRRAFLAGLGGGMAALAGGGALLTRSAWPEGSSPGVPPAPVADFPGNRAANGDAAAGGRAIPLLVDAAWLRAQRAAAPTVSLPPGSTAPLVLDLSPLRAFRGGRVEGAAHAWWQDTIDPHYPAYGVVLKDLSARGPALLSRLGVGPVTTVVAYDRQANRYAARLVWLLRSVGHQRAAVLDGGLAAWRGAGGGVERGWDEVPPPPADPPAPVRPQRGFIVGTRELRDRLGDPTLAVLDARTADETADDLGGRTRRGRIPGSVVLPWPETLRDGAGRLREPADLATRLSGLGLSPEREVAVVARLGVETGQPWLVLRLLGYDRVRVYDQAWAEWGADAALPIEPV